MSNASSRETYFDRFLRWLEWESEAERATLAERLLAAPDIRLLATSREPLRLPGEQEWPVRPLDVPEESPPDPAVLAQVESVQLLTDRARPVRPDLAVEADQGAAHVVLEPLALDRQDRIRRAFRRPAVGLAQRARVLLAHRRFELRRQHRAALFLVRSVFVPGAFIHFAFFGRRLAIARHSSSAVAPRYTPHSARMPGTSSVANRYWQSCRRVSKGWNSANGVEAVSVSCIARL